MKLLDGIAVVGAGAAGVSAAVEAVRLGARALVLDADVQAGGIIRHAFEVRNFPGGTRSGEEIAEMFRRQLEQWGIPVERRLVVRIEACGERVRLVDGSGGCVEARAAVVATGTAPVVPEVTGLHRSFEPGSGVYPFARCALEDGPPSSAAVIGGSDVALDQARFLAHRGIVTTVICRRNAPAAPRWLVEAAESEGVTLMTGLAVSGVSGRAGDLELATAPHCGEREGPAAAQGPLLRAESVVVAAGRRPVLPGIAGAPPPLARLAGDVRGRPGRYLSAAMADGCLAAREILCGAG